MTMTLAQAQAQVDGEPSPLSVFVTFITLLSKYRDLGSRANFGFEYDDVARDLQMVLQDQGTIGVRSRWVRRVAIPLLQAWKVLKKEGPEIIRAREAKYLVEQCADVPIRQNLLEWLAKEYGI